MKTIKGPAIFLAQFIGDESPFNSLDAIAGWAAELGYAGLQIPTSDPRFIDLAKAAESQAYCDDLRATLDRHGVVVTELSTHLQGQLVAVHPAYDTLFDGFAAPEVRGAPSKRQAWAVDQLHLAAKASANLGLSAHATFSGALAWPYLYPWPQRPPGLVENAFDELARRWRPILNAFDDPFSGEKYRLDGSRSAIREAKWYLGETCTTAPPSRCFSSGLAITLAAASSTIPATLCCRGWTTSTTSTSTANASGCSTSRTRS